MPTIDFSYQSGFKLDSSIEEMETTFLSTLPLRGPPLDFLYLSVPLHSNWWFPISESHKEGCNLLFTIF